MRSAHMRLSVSSHKFQMVSVTRSYLQMAGWEALAVIVLVLSPLSRSEVLK